MASRSHCCSSYGGFAARVALDDVIFVPWGLLLHHSPAGALFTTFILQSVLQHKHHPLVKVWTHSDDTYYKNKGCTRRHHRQTDLSGGVELNVYKIYCIWFLLSKRHHHEARCIYSVNPLSTIFHFVIFVSCFKRLWLGSLGLALGLSGSQCARSPKCDMFVSWGFADQLASGPKYLQQWWPLTQYPCMGTQGLGLGLELGLRIFGSQSAGRHKFDVGVFWRILINLQGICRSLGQTRPQMLLRWKPRMSVISWCKVLATFQHHIYSYGLFHSVQWCLLKFCDHGAQKV